MRGWHANNGASLGNPRLGFVCVSEDMTGEFGFCGYFKEFDHELSEVERLQFAKDERPPPFNPSAQPKPPAAEWDEARLAKAYRNYAVEFVRNSVTALTETLGRVVDRAVQIFGGSGFAKGLPLERFYRDARIFRIFDGTSELHRSVIARSLLKGTRNL